jgi:hypothetical protein
MSKIRVVFTVVTILAASALFASVCFADSVTYTIFGPFFQVADCTFSEGPGSYTVFATLHLSAPARSLKVSAPPTCGGSGISWNYAVSGDPFSLLTVDFGGCISGSVQLFTAQFNVDGCCPTLINGPVVIGPSQDGPPILIGCDDTPRFLIPPCSATSPSLLTPANGATTPLAPFMSWNYVLGDYCQGGIGLSIFQIQYGTDPANLDQVLGTLDNTQAPLPELVPNTQYFWRVRVLDDFAWYTGSMVNFSDTWSFMTEGPVPTERTTWGAVKALYEE